MNSYPDGTVAVVAQLSVRRGAEAVQFYRSAFGAEVDFQFGGGADDPEVVAQLSIGASTFWVEDESPDHDNYSPESVAGPTTRMLLRVDDPAAVVAQAVSAGAVEVYDVAERHGWLIGRVKDPYGHHWEIGRPTGPWPPSP